jgi:competence protein ComEA
VNGIVVKDGLRDRLESLIGRRVDVGVVAALVVIVVAVALVLWLRGAPAQIAPPARVPPEAAAPAGTESAPVLVHVAGAVRRPGLYELTDGERVADAIKAAHGARPRADLDGLNLASPVTDGMQVLVPKWSESGPAPVAPAGASPAPEIVNINSSDQATLETIPGIGPVTAMAILEYRASVGSFGSVDELIDVTGIGPATLEAIRPYVSV